MRSKLSIRIFSNFASYRNFAKHQRFKQLRTSFWQVLYEFLSTFREIWDGIPSKTQDYKLIPLYRQAYEREFLEWWKRNWNMGTLCPSSLSILPEVFHSVFQEEVIISWYRLFRDTIFLFLIRAREWQNWKFDYSENWKSQKAE